MKKLVNEQSGNFKSMFKEIQETHSELGNSPRDFKIIHELGRGSYGVVYKVQALKDNNVYVLKKIPLRHLKPKQQKEALQEVLILRKLTHPNIIHYYASFLEEETLYILMEYAAGGDLHSLMKKQKDKKKLFSEMELWRFAVEITLGLSYLHSQNIIHRDIKCLNIFLNENRKVKIGDMGVSKIVDNADAIQGTRVGTPLYLSPELVKRQPYDYKIDIWAMGCILYHLACLEPPFTGENLIVLGNNIVSKQPKPLPSSYSERFQNFLDRLMSKKPTDRPNMRDLFKMFPSFIRKEYDKLEGTKDFDFFTSSTCEGFSQRQAGFQPSPPIQRVSAPIPHLKEFSKLVKREEEAPNYVSVVNPNKKKEIFNNSEEEDKNIREDKIDRKSHETEPKQDTTIQKKKLEDKLIPVVRKLPEKFSASEENKLPSKESPRFTFQGRIMRPIIRPILIRQNIFRPDTAVQRTKPTLAQLMGNCKIQGMNERFFERPISANIGKFKKIIPHPNLYMEENRHVDKRPQSAMVFGKISSSILSSSPNTKSSLLQNQKNSVQ